MASFVIRRAPVTEWHDMVTAMNDVYAYFTQLNVPTLAASRIDAYRTAFDTFLRAAAVGTPLSRSQAQNVLETMVEFEHLRMIVRAARQSQEPDRWRAKIRTLISGTPFASRELSGSSPRDTQFECLVGAVLERGGYSVDFSEPDLRVQDGTRHFNVAVKRPRKVTSVVSSCRKAARQIAAQTDPGIIAFDLTPSLLPSAYATVTHHEEAIIAVQQSVRQFLGATFERLKYVAAGRAVAFLFVVHIPGMVKLPAGPQLMSAIYWHVFNLQPGAAWVRDLAIRSSPGVFGAVQPTERAAAERLIPS